MDVNRTLRESRIRRRAAYHGKWWASAAVLAVTLALALAGLSRSALGAMPALSAPASATLSQEAPALPARTAAFPRAQHVIILIMDGGRYDETFGDPERLWVPRMWGEMAPQGVVLTSFYNLGHPITVSGHATLETALRQRVEGEGEGRFVGPTLFELARDQLDLPAEKVWLIFGKTKLGRVLQRSLSMLDDVPSTWAHDVDDDTVAQKLWEVLAEHQPRLVLVNFPAVDLAGHRGNWEGYTEGIRRFDELAAETWRRIQSDPVMANKTALFITNDHGRQHDDWTKHGDDSEGSRHIMFLGLGPDFRAGFVSDHPRHLADLAVTTAYLLGVQLPVDDGDVMEEIFQVP